MIEQDENDRFVAKPFNVNEVNKQKAMEEEQQPKQSLVTASILATQAKARQSTDPDKSPMMANSITMSNDITPSFQNTTLPTKQIDPSTGGPMTFEPGSLA